MNIELFTWKDTVEILFLSTAIYYFSLWLIKDSHKNLLGYFYSYCLIAFFSYHLQLGSINYLLWVASPVLFMLFILMHQNTLQKNFIALRNIIPARKESGDWLDILIRSCLISINNNKEILCIIEHHDNLQDLLMSPFNLQAPLTEDLLHVVLESPSYNQQQLLWINSQGKLLGINAQWINHSTPFASADSSWKDQALFATTQVDALILHIAPTKRTFDIVVKGKAFDDIRTNNVLPFIKKYLASPHTHGDTYAQQPSAKRHSQRTS